MLSHPADFEHLRTAGRTRSDALLRARVARTELPLTRFGLATGKDLGGAVVRNRVRRRLRAALRSFGPALQPGWDVLIVAQPSAAAAPQAELDRSLARLLERGGVLLPGAGRPA
jgi:ribonuclease P protein component